MNIVRICDASDNLINEMLDYCHNNLLSLESFENTDVSDVSGRWDTIASFRFKDECDAIVFKLKYR